ncbi:MAG: hypothetical protein AAB552_02485 [Patescibacteria group bacterium]
MSGNVKGTLAEQLSAVWPSVAMSQAENVCTEFREVEDRHLVWSQPEAIFDIEIPRAGKAVEVVNLTHAHYLLLTRPVLGGAVNLYVHHNNPVSLLGARIYAHLEVWERGRGSTANSLHLHFSVALEAERITHRWRVFQKAPEDEVDIRGMRSPVIFKTPPPLLGAVGICVVKKVSE